MAVQESGLRSPLGRVRGLGSARGGTHHWWAQRITAVALIPLTLWFVWSLLHVMSSGYAGYVAWISNPINATALVLVIAVAFHHAQLGLQVVFEDYIPGHVLRAAVNIFVKFLCYGFGALSIVSILTVALGR
jgi:succinate dehydrogenase / fumarate reductase membrane anchor subunit